jgi:two-component system sensor histidine kinase RegB
MPVPPRGRIRLRTLVTLRWLAVAGQTVAVLTVAFGLGFELPLYWCLAVIAASAALNLVLTMRQPATLRLNESQVAAMLAFDIVQLFALLFLTGGIQNPFSLLFLAPVTISATMLTVRYTVALGALSLLCLTVLALWSLPLPWRAGETFSLPPLFIAGIWVALALGLGFIAAYAWRVAAEARHMSAALEATEAVLAREQRLSALGGLAAAAAHELGTPLATIALVARELERDLPGDGPQKEDIRLLREQAERCRAILRKLSEQSTGDDAMHARQSLSALLEEVAAPHRGFGIDITIRAAPARDTAPARQPVLWRRPEILHGLGNLVENAVDFAHEKVAVTAQWDDRRLTLHIADDGPGVSPEIAARLGEPYVTSRPRRGNDGGDPEEAEGMGLGFFIAKTLLERTGATLRLAAARTGEGHGLGGALVTVSWPLDAILADD